MKIISGLLTLILGVAGVLLSVGLQTIWAQPEQRTAEVRSEVTETSLTVITDGLNELPSQEDPVTYTLEGDGEFTIMLGQTRDVEAWVGETAHNKITGIDTETEDRNLPEIIIEHVAGDEQAPNPVNSDLWTDTQTVEGSVTQRWTEPVQGDWSLLVYPTEADATAPTNISVTWVNPDPDSPWIMPLLIGGIILILVGLALIIWGILAWRAKAKKPSGRRAVGQPPTALVPIVAQETKAVKTQPEAEPEPEPETDETLESEQELQPPKPIPSDAPVGGNATYDSIDTHTESPDSPEQPTPRDKDDDEHYGGNAVIDVADKPQRQKTEEKTPLKRLVAGISALGLGLGIGVSPAYGDTVEEPGEVSEQSAETGTEPQDQQPADDTEENTHPPVLLDTQVRTILERLGNTVATADESGDASALEPRVTGQAAQLRSEYYRNQGIDSDEPSPQSISASPVEAVWVPEDDAFPRTFAAIVGGSSEVSPQVVLLRQDDPRSQYKLIANAPMAPGVEIPQGTVTDTGVEVLAEDTSEGLRYSGEQALTHMMNYLDDPDSDSGGSIADSSIIEAIHESQQTDQDGLDVSVTRRSYDANQVLRLSDGSALVFGVVSTSERFQAEEGHNIKADALGDTVAELASEVEIDEESGFTLRYREQLAIHVPAEGEISLIGYDSVLSSVLE